MSVDRSDVVTALIVHQWLSDWNDVYFPDTLAAHRRKPQPFFYLFTLSAPQLRRLASVYRRQAEGPRTGDTSVQRALEQDRTAEIKRFVRGGFPWSGLADRRKETQDFKNLRMPGWLPISFPLRQHAEMPLCRLKML